VKGAAQILNLQNSPLISVLLPVYNGQAYVREAIESVLAQDYPNFEFVIVDNASNDGTPAIIGEYSVDERIKVYRNEKTLPRLDNFVRAFDLASGESCWLKFIGDDDRFLPSCLSEMVRVAEQSANVGLVSSHYYTGERLVKGILPPGQEWADGPAFLRRLLLEPEARSTVHSPASLLVSHQAYRELGGFRTDLLHADSELFYRILNYYDLAYVHRPLTITGFHSGSGQAGSTRSGHTFAEAYLIRYLNLKLYDRVHLSAGEKERIKFNLVTDSTGFMLSRLVAGDFGAVFSHLKIIPAAVFYHLFFSLAYFLGLGVKKLVRREPVRLLKQERRGPEG